MLNHRQRVKILRRIRKEPDQIFKIPYKEFKKELNMENRRFRVFHKREAQPIQSEEFMMGGNTRYTIGLLPGSEEDTYLFLYFEENHQIAYAYYINMGRAYEKINELTSRYAMPLDQDDMLWNGYASFQALFEWNGIKELKIQLR